MTVPSRTTRTLRAARDLALGDERAGDRADPRGFEQLAHLGLAERGLDLGGLEHALHRRAQLLDRAVDDRVGADLDALAVGDLAGVADGPHVEGEDHALGGGREHHVGLVDAADAAVDDVDLDLLLGELGDLVLDRLERPRDVGLDDQAELLDGALLGELEDVLEGDLAPGAARERLGLQAVGALARELAGAALVLDDAHVLARLGHAVEAEHLDRLAGRRALELLRR